MTACSSRAFLRINRAWKFSSSYFVSSKFLPHFQGCSRFHVLSYSTTTMDRNKKQKTLRPVWRPISSQSSSHEGSLEQKSEVGVQVQIVQCSSTDSVSEVQEFSKDGEMTWERTCGVAELSITGVEEEGSAVDVESDNVQLMNESGKHTVSVEVAASLVRFIKGKWGSTQKQIEEETGAKIIFPSSRKENSIGIEGVSPESIAKASEKIQLILEEAVKSPNLDYSHFISLPLAVHPGLVDKLINFQNSILGTSDSSKDEKVLSDSDVDPTDEAASNDQQLDAKLNVAFKQNVEEENKQVKLEIKKIPLVSYLPKASNFSSLSDMGIDKSIFIKPKTFHLTVLMLKLWNNERITAATEVFQRISSKVMDVLEGKPVSVRLKGLECMRGSLAKAKVLYTPVEVIGGEDRLLRACQVITDAFIEAGLVLEKDAGKKLKLHGTVMNARHRKSKDRKKRFDSFDARSIVEKYGSEDWGEYVIREAHLSQRFVFDENGYYHCCASIPFPENNNLE